MAADRVPRRAFRFGVQSFSAGPAAEWRDKARRAEDQGYAVMDDFAAVVARLAGR